MPADGVRVFVDADHPHTVEAGWIGDEYPLTFGEHRVVGGVPRHRQSFGDSGHAQVLADKGFQRPPQTTARQRSPRLGCGTGTCLAPRMTAAGASVAAHSDQQRGGPPPERLMGQPSGHGVARAAFLAAPPTPSILVDDPTRQECPVRLNALPGHLQPELIEAAERGQIRASEGSVRHVEVFQLGSVRTPIIGRPRPLPRQRRADHPYTLNCEEP